MAKKGKNRLAILTFFRFRRTDVCLIAKSKKAARCAAFLDLAIKLDQTNLDKLKELIYQKIVKSRRPRLKMVQKELAVVCLNL